MDYAYLFIVQTSAPGSEDTFDVQIFATKDAGDREFDYRVADSAKALGLTEDSLADVDGPKSENEIRWAVLDGTDTVVTVSLRRKEILS